MRNALIFILFISTWVFSFLATSKAPTQISSIADVPLEAYVAGVSAILGLILWVTAPKGRKRKIKPELIHSIYCCDEEVANALIKGGIPPEAITCPLNGGINSATIQETIQQHAFIVVNANQGSVSMDDLKKASALQDAGCSVRVRFEETTYEPQHQLEFVLYFLSAHGLTVRTTEELINELKKFFV